MQILKLLKHIYINQRFLFFLYFILFYLIRISYAYNNNDEVDDDACLFSNNNTLKLLNLNLILTCTHIYV